MSGAGDYIDISQQEAVADNQIMPGPYVAFEDQIMRRTDIPRMAPRHLFPCKDGYVWIQAVIPGAEEWQRFSEAMGNPDWADTELFHDRVDRGQHWDALEPLIALWAAGVTKEEFRRLAKEHQLTITTLDSWDEVLANPQLRDREFFVDITNPEAGAFKYPGAPYKLSRTPCRANGSAPRIGEHNEQVYCQKLGYGKKDLVRMAQAGII
jgi:crotonobetainyl-CoA:carnitine CoA-transferase CaiB-like acyl-CoA transferase